MKILFQMQGRYGVTGKPEVREMAGVPRTGDSVVLAGEHFDVAGVGWVPDSPAADVVVVLDDRRG